MLIRVNVVVLCLLDVVYGCIPTQQVDDPATPCKVCQKVYDKTCVGNTGSQPWCATAATVGVTYMNGLDELIHFGDSETCHFYYNCPAGTTPVIDVYGLTPQSDPYLWQVMGQCAETGANAGQWYYGLTDITPWTPIPLKSVKCVG